MARAELDMDGNESFKVPAVERRSWHHSREAQRHLARLHIARRELQFFYATVHGRVPAVGELPTCDVAAASRIAGWLSGLDPADRGAFVVRYDGRRWPARLVRRFGGLTSLVVRIAAMRRPRGPHETVAQAEEAAVAQLLADIVTAAEPEEVLPPFGPDSTPTRSSGTESPAKELRRLRRLAKADIRHAERAYLEARGDGPSVAPDGGRGK